MWYWPFPSAETSLITLNANLLVKIWAGFLLLEVHWHRRAMNRLWKERLLVVLLVKQFYEDILELLDLWLSWRKSLRKAAVLSLWFQWSMWYTEWGHRSFGIFSSLLFPFHFAKFSVSILWWPSLFFVLVKYLWVWISLILEAEGENCAQYLTK